MARGQDYRFGPFRLDLASERLWRGADEMVLRRKSFAVLGYLLAHVGRLVSRDEVLQAVWPGIVVNDAALTVCISELRQVLGDVTQTPQYIETVHGRGYRFIGTITAAPSLEGVPQAGPTQSITPSSFPSSPQPAALSPAALVGREAEFAQLEQCLEQAWHGARQIVFVTAELGMGKTTLVEAFLARVAARAPLWLARGQCIVHYGASEAYLPVLDALGRLCREPGREPLLAWLSQHAPTWLVQMPALLDTAELEALQRRVLGATRERMLRELAEAVGGPDRRATANPGSGRPPLERLCHAGPGLLAGAAARAGAAAAAGHAPAGRGHRAWPSPAGRQTGVGAASAVSGGPAGVTHHSRCRAVSGGAIR